MAPSLFLDLDKFDLTQFAAGPREIEAVNPQRGSMRHLDGVIWMDAGTHQAIGFKDVREDEFWVEGHIPGRPLLPGVMMIEAGAQFAGYLMKQRIPNLGFIGFVGCDEVKFRGQVPPGKRLYLLAQEVSFKPRRFICAVQGVVDGQLVFEAKITGMPI